MISVLVTGVGSLLGQGILKSIKDSSLNCNVTGTDYFPSAVGLYWVDKGYILPDILKHEVSVSHWIDSLIKIIIREKINIIIPGLDFEIPILAEKKTFIEKETGAIVLVSSKEVVNMGDDKWETFKYLKNNSFHYPNSSLPETADIFIQSNPFPLIVKPRFGHTSKNVFLVENKRELNSALKTCDKPIVQEFLEYPEKEYTCSATYIDKKILTLISLKRTLKNGNTQQAFSENTEEIDEYVRKLTLSIKPCGPINFQLRHTERGPVVFEINTRFSGTTPIRTLLGVNEVEAVLLKLTGTETDIEYRKKYGTVIRYFENQYIPLDHYKTFSE